MVYLKRPNVFPLSVADFRALANGHPTALEDGLAIANISFAKPGNDASRFRLTVALIPIFQVWDEAE